jgi:hypothetical protein
VTCTMRPKPLLSGRGFLAVGLVGLAGLGIAVWILPAGLMAVTDESRGALVIPAPCRLS